MPLDAIKSSEQTCTATTTPGSAIETVNLRRATSADAAMLALVGAATFLEAFTWMLPGVDILAHATKNHTAEAYAAYLDAPDTRITLAVTGDDAPVGFAMLTAPDLPSIETFATDIELKRIYLFSRFRKSPVLPTHLSSRPEAEHFAAEALSSRPEAAHFADEALSSRPEAAHFADEALSSRPEAAHFAAEALSSRPEAAHFADEALSSRPKAAHFAAEALSSRPEAAHFADEALSSGPEEAHFAAEALSSRPEAAHFAAEAERPAVEPANLLRPGQALMNAAIADACGLGRTRLLLGTHAGNERAIAFYRRNGFVEVGTRTFLVGTQVCSDLVFARKL